MRRGCQRWGVGEQVSGGDPRSRRRPGRGHARAHPARRGVKRGRGLRDRAGGGRGRGGSSARAVPGTGKRLAELRRRTQPGPARAFPVALPSAVYERDRGCCAYVDPVTARRCGTREGHEIVHRVPVALGGGDTLDNGMLLCHAHNWPTGEVVFWRKRIAAIVASRRGVSVGASAAGAVGTPGGHWR